MIYITGDTHGGFQRVFDFCIKMKTSKDDIMIILGDAGINFSGGIRDDIKKEYIDAMPITLFCIHGNHEQRPDTIPTYHTKEWHGGCVYVEEEHPNILFAKDSEVFDFKGLKTLVAGGAYSIDKAMRIAYGYGWWEDEQPSAAIKAAVEKRLEDLDRSVDVVLTHTAPLKYEPVEMFLPGIDQTKVDKATEIWLDEIENKLKYQKWYCGHYHTEKKIDKLEIMFENFDKFIGSRKDDYFSVDH